MTDENKRVDVLARARQTLKTAERGLEMMKSGPRNRLIGLRNVAVFGRSVTFVLHNLTSCAPTFDAWYAPRVAEMKGDTLMQFFKTLRNNIEKQGQDHASSKVENLSFSTRDIAKFPQPPGALSFFIGDRAGGSGWAVETAPGVIEHYYVNLPPEWGRVGMSLAGAPEDYDNDAVALCERYVGKLAKLVADAEVEFGRRP